MSYDVFAAPVPVPENRRETMIGIRFDSQVEAFDQVYSLRRSGWFVYRVSGSHGFEMTEAQIEQYCFERLKSEEQHRNSVNSGSLSPR